MDESKSTVSEGNPCFASGRFYGLPSEEGDLPGVDGQFPEEILSNHPSKLKIDGLRPFAAHVRDNPEESEVRYCPASCTKLIDNNILSSFSAFLVEGVQQRMRGTVWNQPIQSLNISSVNYR